jgi:hypothetical protein
VQERKELQLDFAACRSDQEAVLLEMLLMKPQHNAG